MNKEFMILSGQRIKKYRMNKNMSQDDLAVAISISKTHMSHIENGENASLELFIKIVNVLGITLDDVFYDALKHGKNIIIPKLDILYNGCTTKELKLILKLNDTLLNELRSKDSGEV